MLKRLAHAIVAGRRQILAIAALIAVVGAWGVANGRINYDLLSYLPEDMPSVRGFEILTDEFDLGNEVQIMLEGTGDVQTQGIVERIRTIEGVAEVQWVTDLAQLEEPREFWDETLTENYFAEGGTLVRVSMTASANDPAFADAVDEIRDVLADETAYITGTQQLELQDVMSSDQVRFALVALVLVTVVLLLTIPSIVVPVLFVVTIGVAVLANLGLSYYIGQELSYITGVIVFALQFAVTMDYALFLYHRYEEECRRLPRVEAMEVAIASTFKSIAAASATTISGFLALIAMHLGFGADMGLTLARGVFITLIAVLTLLPALLLVSAPLIEKVRHRVPRFDFSRLAGFIAKHAGVFTLVAALLFVPAVWGYSRITLSYNLDKSLPDDLPSVQADEHIAEAFGRASTAYLILEDAGSAVDMQRLSRELEAIEGVDRVFGYSSLVDPRIPDEFVPAEARASFYAAGYTYLSLDLAYSMEDDEFSPVLGEVQETSDAVWPGKTYLTGQEVLVNDMEVISQGDAERINLISVVAIFLIVAIAFRSITVPAVLLGIIELAILLNQAISSVASQEMIFVAPLAIGAIQLGATVDYAIIVTTRYEEELGKLGDRVQAIRVAVSESSQSILVSAATMFAATIGMAVLSRVGIISELTMLISRGAIISFAVVIFLLPAVLVVAQPVLERTSLGWPRHTKKGE
ncbi:MAG: MMPL family transporter [Coriobacteriia bacterium]